MATQRKTGKAAKAARNAPRVKARPAAKAKAKPAPKAAKPAPRGAKPAARPVAKVVGKPAVKGKPAPRVIGKPAVKGKPAPKVIGKPAVKGQPAAARKLKPVVKTAEPAANVRPLGVLPPESRAKGHTLPTPHVNRPPTTSKPAPRPTLPQGAQGVTEKDLKEFEQRLLAERQKIMREMGHLESTVLKVNPRDSAGDLSGYSFHMADAGTDAMEREKAFLFASAEGRLLMDIVEALRRLYRGEYGICEICEKPIARARLEAMPYARLCVSCKEKEEKAGRAASQTGQ